MFPWPSCLLGVAFFLWVTHSISNRPKTSVGSVGQRSRWSDGVERVDLLMFAQFQTISEIGVGTDITLLRSQNLMSCAVSFVISAIGRRD